MDKVKQLDAVVVGAGFSGLYMLYRLREAGFTTRVYEAGDGVGGVWYWNRYPGARCDTESIHYCYTFSEELYKEWTWSSRYPEQEELLSYLNYVADKFQLRSDIQLNTRVTKAHYDEELNRWMIYTNDGEIISAKYFITGVGCLSTSNIPTFEGLDSFGGEWYHTGNWPHEEVDFTGKRVGVIGTGSTGVQIIPTIADEVKKLTVFQRTPQYSVPANNYPYSAEFIQKTKSNFREIKQALIDSPAGFIVKEGLPSAIEDTPENRDRVFEEAWEKGGVDFQFSYKDFTTNPHSNRTAVEFIHSKIKGIIDEQGVAETLLPQYYYATKRPIKDSGYYETYNKENVELVDVKSKPIIEITPKGIQTEKQEYELDSIIFATGYDAMTGALFKMDIRGRDGISLKQKWKNGEKVQTYLGIANAEFPNMFMITGPESPSVLTNMLVSIQQHVEWISGALQYARRNEIDLLEAKKEAEEGWSSHCADVASKTLYVQTDSWYTGSNVVGKPRNFLIYLGGLKNYREICNKIAEKEYEGFSKTVMNTPTSI
ncbi:flavin-containing monooxygenase [Alkalihalobacillus sp. 1P02AB]|uniref:flavin-containing monooxygenase n=1 Tax=Alkalihalobacillus sp. 1P02AB TaxID=3132260 RepID=UPI0039A61E9A